MISGIKWTNDSFNYSARCGSRNGEGVVVCVLEFAVWGTGARTTPYEVKACLGLVAMLGLLRPFSGRDQSVIRPLTISSG